MPTIMLPWPVCIRKDIQDAVPASWYKLCVVMIARLKL